MPHAHASGFPSPCLQYQPFGIRRSRTTVSGLSLAILAVSRHCAVSNRAYGVSPVPRHACSPVGALFKRALFQTAPTEHRHSLATLAVSMPHHKCRNRQRRFRITQRHVNPPTNLSERLANNRNLPMQRRQRMRTHQNAALFIRFDRRPRIFQRGEGISTGGAQLLLRHTVCDIL